MKKTIIVDAYITPEGSPTCALNFGTGEVCIFMRSKKFGTFDYCALDDSESLLRRDHDGCGHIIPCKSCLVWSE